MVAADWLSAGRIETRLLRRTVTPRDTSLVLPSNCIIWIASLMFPQPCRVVVGRPLLFSVAAVSFFLFHLHFCSLTVDKHVCIQDAWRNDLFSIAVLKKKSSPENLVLGFQAICVQEVYQVVFLLFHQFSKVVKSRLEPKAKRQPDFQVSCEIISYTQ